MKNKSDIIKDLDLINLKYKFELNIIENRADVFEEMRLYIYNHLALHKLHVADFKMIDVTTISDINDFKYSCKVVVGKKSFTIEDFIDQYLI